VLTTAYGSITKNYLFFLQKCLGKSVVPGKNLCYNDDITGFLGAEMNITDLQIDKTDLAKLMGTASGDAALLLLYLRCGNPMEEAAKLLHMTESRLSCAAATLRQLGLWQPDQKRFVPGERPCYSEKDVLQAMDNDRDFRSLYGEIERQLGKALTNEELKIVLGFVRYLNLSPDVVSVLVCYCKDRARRKGSLRNPSLRTIEKEAYAWAENVIDTMEDAAAFIQRQNLRSSQIGQLMGILQIRGRNLTAAEERFAKSWLEMGFPMDVIAMLYEKTCLNTGGMSWPYMNRVLTTWHNAGAHTLKQIEAFEKSQKKKAMPRGASGTLGETELSNIQKLLQED